MKYLLISAIAAGFLACGGEKKEIDTHAGHNHAKHETTQFAKSERLIYYTCPMDSHKHIHHREMGKCEECGMSLVAGVITTEEKMDFYGCPMLMHSHIRQETAGKCDECGMALKPMRLVK
ncbi:MAG: hypothetical protein ISS00_00755 [Candidatus Marinimicrobia bacterium]|nr:hypothetical protein [Candidatus Neomarinimicrobiota bacterium]